MEELPQLEPEGLHIHLAQAMVGQPPQVAPEEIHNYRAEGPGEAPEVALG